MTYGTGRHPLRHSLTPFSSRISLNFVRSKPFTFLFLNYIYAIK